MLFSVSRLSLAAFILAQMAGSPLVAQTLAGDGTLICGGDYVVERGDTLSELAQRAYGISQLYDRIVEANYDQLRGDPDLLAVGMSIAIPCLDASGEPSTADIASAISAEGPLSDAELDALFGPVALFPDPVLTPVLVAATLPIDVIKAGRFVAESANLTDAERAQAASAQDWDPAVRELAAGFPDLITRMSDHIDWTEQAGEAVLAQTDDVLDTIQRLRSSAMEYGYLVDNEAQNVEVTNDTVYIEPAQPGVVYVPTYDTQVVYTTPITTAPIYYYDDDNSSYNNDYWEDALVGGAIFLGSAIVLDEIFDDDDWGDVGGWGDEDLSIDWDRGDINIDRGDINIDRENVDIDVGDRVTVGGGDRVTIGDSDQRTRAEREQARTERREQGTRENRPGTEAAGDRIERAGTDAASRDAARQRIEQRQVSGGEVARLPAERPANRTADRPVERRPSAAEGRPATSHRDAPIARPTQRQSPAAAPQRTRTPSRSDNAFASPQRERQPQASNRGRQSTGNRNGGRRR